MNQVGVNQQYNQLIGRYKDIPFANSVTFDVNQYVTEKATDGLFFVVGQEEKKIRTNPAAQVTDLLKEVFGSIKKSNRQYRIEKRQAGWLLGGPACRFGL